MTTLARPPGSHPLPFKIGDRVEATRDACFSWNEDVKEGDRFTITNGEDLYLLHLVPGFYKLVEDEDVDELADLVAWWARRD